LRERCKLSNSRSMKRSRENCRKKAEHQKKRRREMLEGIYSNRAATTQQLISLLNNSNNKSKKSQHGSHLNSKTRSFNRLNNSAINLLKPLRTRDLSYLLMQLGEMISSVKVLTLTQNMDDPISTHLRLSKYINSKYLVLSPIRRAPCIPTPPLIISLR
jgi:hypothetical protein